MDDRELFRNDAADDESEERALAQGEADVAAGRTVPHEEVARWLRSWGTAHELPPPKSGQWRR